MVIQSSWKRAAVDIGGALLVVALVIWATLVFCVTWIGNVETAKSIFDTNSVSGQAFKWLYEQSWLIPAVLAGGILLLLLIARARFDGKLIASLQAAGSSHHQQSSDTNPIDKQIDTWTLPLREVRGKHYARETVLLDGFDFIDCDFVSVTFLYNGTNTFRVTDCRIHFDPAHGGVQVQSTSPSVMNALQLMQWAQSLHGNTPVFFKTSSR